MLSPSQYILVTTRLTTGSTGLVGDSYRKPSIATIAGKGGNPNDKRKGPMVRCHFPFHWYTLQSVTKNTLNISCVSVWNTVPNRSQIKWPLGTQMVSAYLWTKHPIYFEIRPWRLFGDEVLGPMAGILKITVKVSSNLRNLSLKNDNLMPTRRREVPNRTAFSTQEGLRTRKSGITCRRWQFYGYQSKIL